jgi:hypothetical protein
VSKNENSRVGRPFAQALRSLLLEREEFLTQTGNINWRAVADALPGVHYETLRKAVAGERHPGVDLIEKVAALVGVPPHYFAEWQLAHAMRQFDARPAPLGVGFDSAMDNLRRWTESQKGRRRKVRETKTGMA